MRHRIIVFDFDGTLVDSNSLKRQAFDYAFADRPECLRELPETLNRLNGESRYEIIESLVGRIQSLTPDQRLAETGRRTEAYSAWVEERILVRARESPAGLLLHRWQRYAALYVCSLTPTDALLRILDKAGWSAYFAGVQGYPVNKTDMLRRTMSCHGVKGNEALMVGDGEGDETAARTAGTAFFRIREIPDLKQLDRYLCA